MTYEEKKIIEKLREVRGLYISLLKRQGVDIEGYTPPLYMSVWGNGFINAFSLKEVHEDRPNEYWVAFEEGIKDSILD